METVGQAALTKMGEKYHCNACDFEFTFTGKLWETIEPYCPGCGSKDLELVKPPSPFPEAICLGAIYLDTLAREEALIHSLDTTKNPEALIERHAKIWEEAAVQSNELDTVCTLNIPCGARTTMGKVGDMSMSICPLLIGRKFAPKVIDDGKRDP